MVSPALESQCLPVRLGCLGCANCTLNLLVSTIRHFGDQSLRPLDGMRIFENLVQILSNLTGSRTLVHSFDLDMKHSLLMKICAMLGRGGIGFVRY